MEPRKRGKEERDHVDKTRPCRALQVILKGLDFILGVVGLHGKEMIGSDRK